MGEISLYTSPKSMSIYIIDLNDIFRVYIKLLLRLLNGNLLYYMCNHSIFLEIHFYGYCNPCFLIIILEKLTLFPIKQHHQLYKTLPKY